MQKEIQTLRHDMKAVLDRLDAADEAKYNDARRLVGLPPVKYRHWSEHAAGKVPVSWAWAGGLSLLVEEKEKGRQG